MYSRPAALAELVETRVALSSGVLALTLRAALPALPLSVQAGVVRVVVASGFDRSPVTLKGSKVGRMKRGVHLLCRRMKGEGTCTAVWSKRKEGDLVVVVWGGTALLIIAIALVVYGGSTCAQGKSKPSESVPCRKTDRIKCNLEVVHRASAFAVKIGV